MVQKYKNRAIDREICLKFNDSKIVKNPQNNSILIKYIKISIYLKNILNKLQNKKLINTIKLRNKKVIKWLTDFERPNNNNNI